MKKISNSAGFTMVEMIAALLLLGIIGVFASMFLVDMVRSYQFAEDNAHLTQKTQVALTRIAVEMTYADGHVDDVQIDDVNKTIVYNATYPNGDTTTGNTIEKTGSDLLLTVNGESYTLTDRVDGFDVAHTAGDGYFTVTLTMRGANNVSRQFEKSVALP